MSSVDLQSVPRSAHIDPASAEAATLAPPLDVRSTAPPDPLTAGGPRAGAARLPFLAVKTLAERGIHSGSVLLLSGAGIEHRALESAHDVSPSLRVTCALIREAAAVHGADFDAVVLVVENWTQTRRLLSEIAERTRPEALLVLLAPVGRRNGAYDREAVHLMLLGAGFDRCWTHEHRRSFCTSARRAQPARARTCSIIVPVYNERQTFPELMRALLAKPLEQLGLEREIIVVESNSTDGTREQVASMAGTPGVKLLWQERPRGKGHAVREGLRAARGDIVLIQDADIEYDVNDYDVLLKPLVEGRAAFVLGSRHSGQGAMRVFTDQRLFGHFCNAGHVCFTTLLNVLYGQSLRDPFTMFKVFRRDCLYGLDFECNRFDFDHELVIKLLLKGYKPLEIPVAYRSRSFKQGKKIRPVSDPLNWMLADFRYRLKPLKPHFDP